MSTAARWGTGRERDAVLRELFYAARAEGMFGPANEVLGREFLPDLFSSFRVKFREPLARGLLDKSEWIGRAWRKLAELPDEKRDNPDIRLCAWLRKCVEEEINSSLLGIKHGLTEAQVKDGVWARTKEHFKLGDDEDKIPASIVDLSAVEDPKDPVMRRAFGSSVVWDHVVSLWVSLAWPSEIAWETVYAAEKRLVRVRMERGRASASELARALPKEVTARRMGTAVAKFVLDPHGFVSALAEGEPPEVAVQLPSVRKALPHLSWEQPGTGSRSRHRPS